MTFASDAISKVRLSREGLEQEPALVQGTARDRDFFAPSTQQDP